MANGIDWEARFGRPPGEWSDSEFKMAMFSILNSQNDTLKALPCAKHTKDIQELQNCNATAIEEVKGKWSLKVSNAQMVGSILGGTAVTTFLIWILNNLFGFLGS